MTIMNIIWLFLVAFFISIGWYTGMRTVQMLDRIVWSAIDNSKIVKAHRKKPKEKNSGKHSRYHETKMGF